LCLFLPAGRRAVGLDDAVTTDDLRQQGYYEPEPDEWPASDGGRDAICDRLALAIDQLRQIDAVRAFAFPVDLEDYPDYSVNIAHPMDLQTIVLRLRNRFYRYLNVYLYISESNIFQTSNCGSIRYSSYCIQCIDI
jgi:hypothetical protein